MTAFTAFTKTSRRHCRRNGYDSHRYLILLTLLILVLLGANVPVIHAAEDETAAIINVSVAAEEAIPLVDNETHSEAQGDGNATASSGIDSEAEGAVEEDVEAESVPPVYAVLLPWVAQVFGLVVFLFLTRVIQAIPYTGILFILGTCMGAGASTTDWTDQLTESISMWIKINHRVLFCCFLPGLLFKDALEINFHLFVTSFWQIMYLAFPMVLGGTYLTALVGVYVFPYGWTMNMALTFGSILAATDPVAVCVLLNEVSAPPRLRMHISGEALWNDGSAVVFYSVFSGLFLYELAEPGLGEDVDVAKGIAIFFRMSLGGVAVGLAFSIGLIFILYILNRRLEKEETVMQVAATATVAYLSFYTADVVCGTSGVIAVVVLGTVTKAFGGGFINDWQIMDSFWSLIEHLLNTLLFTIGGIEFGSIVASRHGHIWNASDWGYLVILYILINAIRFFCLFASYPLLAKIGIGTNWQETVFSGWAGLRGAVAITLSLGLDNLVNEATDDPEKTILTTKLFGMVGGVAFFTLIINASFSGPLLIKLGLVDDTEARKRILKSAEEAARRRLLDCFLHLMTDPRFAFVDFALVTHHVPLLANLTAEELEQAVRENKETVHPSVYRQPNLEHVYPYIQTSRENVQGSMEDDRHNFFMSPDTNKDEEELSTSIPTSTSSESHEADSANVDDIRVMEEKMMDGEVVSTEMGQEEEQGEHEGPNPDLVKDIRIMFVELLRASYQNQLAHGELNAREYKGFLVYVLLQSLDFAHDSVTNGQPLDDWAASQVSSPEFVEKVEDLGRRVYQCCCFKRTEQGAHAVNSSVHSNRSGTMEERFQILRDEQPLQYQLLRLDVLRAIAFIDAHKDAQERLHDEFGKETGELFLAFQAVLKESKEQMNKAADFLRSVNKKELKHIISHHLCMILQQKSANYIQLLHDSGILVPRESRRYLEEIERYILAIDGCRMDEHPGSLECASRQSSGHTATTAAESMVGGMVRRRRTKQKSLL